MEQVGMTKKQQKRMFLAEGIFTWLWLCGLLVTFGTVLLCAVLWVVYADKNFLFCILLSYKRTDFDASHLAWRKCFVTKGLLKTVHEERSSVQIHRKHSLYAQVLDYVSSFPSIR